MEGGVRPVLTVLNPNPALGWQAGVDLIHGHTQPLRSSHRRPAHPQRLSQRGWDQGKRGGEEVFLGFGWMGKA